MKIKLVMAVTADGKIAKSSNHFPDWTSKEDKAFFAEISKKTGVIIMGLNTFRTFPSPLPNRLSVVFSPEKNPKPQDNVKWVNGDLKTVIKDLESNGFNEAILGGGAYMNSLFLEEKLINEIIITIEPKLFGQGISLFAKDHDINLELIEHKKLNKNSVLLKYKVIYE